MAPFFESFWFGMFQVKKAAKVSPKFPDFKKVIDGDTPFWLDSKMPSVVLKMLDRTSSKFQKPKDSIGSGTLALGLSTLRGPRTALEWSLGGDREAQWQSLFDSPSARASPAGSVLKSPITVLCTVNVTVFWPRKGF